MVTPKKNMKTFLAFVAFFASIVRHPPIFVVRVSQWCLLERCRSRWRGVVVAQIMQGGWKWGTRILAVADGGHGGTCVNGGAPGLIVGRHFGIASKSFVWSVVQHGTEGGKPGRSSDNIRS